jgi:hypothetical protein
MYDEFLRKRRCALQLHLQLAVLHTRTSCRAQQSRTPTLLSVTVCRQNTVDDIFLSVLCSSALSGCARRELTAGGLTVERGSPLDGGDYLGGVLQLGSQNGPPETLVVLEKR